MQKNNTSSVLMELWIIAFLKFFHLTMIWFHWWRPLFSSRWLKSQELTSSPSLPSSHFSLKNFSNPKKPTFWSSCSDLILSKIWPSTFNKSKPLSKQLSFTYPFLAYIWKWKMISFMIIIWKMLLLGLKYITSPLYPHWKQETSLTLH